MVDTRSGGQYDPNETPASAEARQAAGRPNQRAPPPPPEPVSMKLSEYVDPKEEKAYASLCAQLAFKPERGEPALAFKMRAQAKLEGIPQELQLKVLLRAVSETDAGTRWLHGLHTQLSFPQTLDEFWTEFSHEYLPVDPVSSAYHRLFSVKQSYMSASTYVDAFRDSVSNLYALEAPYISEEALAHYFLFRASPELRHSVKLQMMGRKYTLSNVLATAVQVGAESARRPPARVSNVVSTVNKGCTICGKKGHQATDCWRKNQSKKPQGKPQGKLHAEGNKPNKSDADSEKGTPK